MFAQVAFFNYFFDRKTVATNVANKVLIQGGQKECNKKKHLQDLFAKENLRKALANCSAPYVCISSSPVGAVLVDDSILMTRSPMPERFALKVQTNYYHLKLKK